jgi:hypothetical protein
MVQSSGLKTKAFGVQVSGKSSRYMTLEPYVNLHEIKGIVIIKVTGGGISDQRQR